MNHVVRSIGASLAFASLAVHHTPARALADFSFDTFDEDVENILKPEGGKYGQFTIDMRYRYEYVDQKDVPLLTHPANASTLRARVGYLTPEFFSFKAFAEYEGLAVVGADDYNSTRNGKLTFPIVADPAENEVNQLWLSFAGIPDTDAKVGRQRILYDNQRFIGPVGWRQLEQTFDAAEVVNLSLPNTNFKAGYIRRVRTVTANNIFMHSPIVNVAYTVPNIGSLTGYGYFLNYDDAADSRNFLDSTATWGFRFHGQTPVVENVIAHYTAEYAKQSDYKENPRSFNNTYVHLAGGTSLKKLAEILPDVTLKMEWERLGSDNGVGFQTPLATLHSFQGWADKFLVTPPDGVRDLYGSVSFDLAGVVFEAIYHDFNADTGGAHYGKEIDAGIGKRFGKHYHLAVKYAQYYADSFATDTQKIWLYATVSF